MTVDELSDWVNEFGHVTDKKQREANRLFVARMYSTLKEGGIWGWPAAGETYRKEGDGFVRVDTATD